MGEEETWVVVRGLFAWNCGLDFWRWLRLDVLALKLHRMPCALLKRQRQIWASWRAELQSYLCWCAPILGQHILLEIIACSTLSMYLELLHGRKDTGLLKEKDLHLCYLQSANSMLWYRGISSCHDFLLAPCNAFPIFVP